MSSTLLRLGLWIILLVVVLYVLQQTYEEAPFVDFFAPAMLQKALALGGILVAAGIVMRILERGAKVVDQEPLRRLQNADRSRRDLLPRAPPPASSAAKTIGRIGRASGRRNRRLREQRRRQSDQEHVHDDAATKPTAG